MASCVGENRPFESGETRVARVPGWLSQTIRSGSGVLAGELRRKMQMERNE